MTKSWVKSEKTLNRAKGGGTVALAAAIAFILIWISALPISVALGLTWGMSAAAVLMAMWLQQRDGGRQIWMAAAMSLGAWALSAACLWLLVYMMQQFVFVAFMAEGDSSLFWRFAAMALFTVLVLGISVWCWLLGAALPGVCMEMRSEAPQHWLKCAASRIRHPAAWLYVPLVIGVLFVSAVLVYFHGTLWTRIAAGLISGSLCMRFLGHLTGFSAVIKTKPDMAFRRRTKRAAWTLGGAAYLLFLAFYAGLSALTSHFVIWPFAAGIALGAAIALISWLLARFKPLYWLVLLVIAAGTLLMLQSVLLLVFYRYI